MTYTFTLRDGLRWHEARADRKTTRARIFGIARTQRKYQPMIVFLFLLYFRNSFFGLLPGILEVRAIGSSAEQLRELAVPPLQLAFLEFNVCDSGFHEDGGHVFGLHDD